MLYLIDGGASLDFLDDLLLQVEEELVPLFFSQA